MTIPDLFFEVPEGTVPFTIGASREGGQHFQAYGALPADDFPLFIRVVSRLAKEAEDNKALAEVGEGDTPAPVEKAEEAADVVERQIQVTMDALQLACPEESIQRIAAGIKHGAEHPIPFPTLISLLNKLLKLYKMAGEEDDDTGDSDSDMDGVERPTEPTSD